MGYNLCIQQSSRKATFDEEGELMSLFTSHEKAKTLMHHRLTHIDPSLKIGFSMAASVTREGQIH